MPRWSVEKNEVDRSPDHNPSFAGIVAEHCADGSARIAIPVRGLGVIVMRASQGLKFEGVSLFTRAEIGFTDKLP